MSNVSLGMSNTMEVLDAATKLAVCPSEALDSLEGCVEHEHEQGCVGDGEGEGEDGLEGGKQISKPFFSVDVSDLNVNVSPSSTVTSSGVVSLPQYFVPLTLR